MSVKELNRLVSASVDAGFLYFDEFLLKISQDLQVEGTDSLDYNPSLDQDPKNVMYMFTPHNELTLYALATELGYRSIGVFMLHLALNSRVVDGKIVCKALAPDFVVEKLKKSEKL